MESSSQCTRHSSRPGGPSSSWVNPGALVVPSGSLDPQARLLVGQSSAKEGVQGHKVVANKLKVALLAVGEIVRAELGVDDNSEDDGMGRGSSNLR